jgi:hypothetical protein
VLLGLWSCEKQEALASPDTKATNGMRSSYLDCTAGFLDPVQQLCIGSSLQH